jgi:hypothetical protein
MEGMAQVTVQQSWHQGDAAFERSHPLPGYGRKAVWALLACRTARVGGHIQACPAGHVERVWDNSCRHRLCPQCAWRQVERWLTRQQVRLLACDHDHVSCTMPEELRGRWLGHVGVMTNVLLATVHETLDERLGEVPYRGAQPGSMAALPTWGQTLVLPPHLHGLVTGGGLTAEGQWRTGRHGVLLPARVVMALLRGKLLAAVDAAVPRGTLTLPDGMPLRHWVIWRNKLGRPKWNVDIRERSPHGPGVLTSVARDRRGGPLAHQRLGAGEQGVVTCRYRLNGEDSGGERTRQGCRRVAIAALIRRDL